MGGKYSHVTLKVQFLSCVTLFKEWKVLIIHFLLPYSCRFKPAAFRSPLFEPKGFHHRHPGCSLPVSLCLILNRPQQLIYWCSDHPLAPLGVKGRQRLSWVRLLSAHASISSSLRLFFCHTFRCITRCFGDKRVNLWRWVCASISLVGLIRYKIF